MRETGAVKNISKENMRKHSYAGPAAGPREGHCNRFCVKMSQITVMMTTTVM